MKKLGIVLATLVLALVVSGCSNQKESNNVKGTPTSDVIQSSKVLKDYANTIANENGTKIDFTDYTKENPHYHEMIVGGLRDGDCFIQTLQAHSNNNIYSLYFRNWKPYSNITVLNIDTTIKIYYEEKTTEGPSDSLIYFSLKNDKKRIIELYRNGQLVKDNIKLGYAIE